MGHIGRGCRAELNSAIVREGARLVPLRTVNKKLKERLVARPAFQTGNLATTGPGDRGAEPGADCR